MNQLIDRKTEFFIEVGDGIELNPEIAKKIAEFERQVKAIKEQEDAMKKAILEQMEMYGIIKISNDELIINYIAETDREALDSKALKAECPEVYDSYCKISTVKPSVRIKVK